VELVLENVIFELTSRCNFNCIHCYVDKKNNDCSYYKINNIIDNLQHAQIDNISISGGEPLLNAEFDEIYQKIRSLGFLVNVLTNGYYVDKFILKDLVMPNLFEISLYGFTEYTYEVVTGVNAFHKVMDNIKKLLNCGANCLIKYVLLKQNIHELNPFIDYCGANKLNYSVTPALFPNGNDFRLSRSELEECEKQHKDIYSFFKGQLLHFCTAGKTLVFSSDGFIKGCPTLPGHSVINVEHTLSDYFLISKEISNKYRESNYKYCPAWEMVEDQSVISQLVR